jgi:hypothetical protein
MKNLSLKKLYKIFEELLEKNQDSSEIDIILELIEQKESELFENTSATGGPSGSLGSSSVGYGSIGTSLRTSVGPVPPANPIRSSGNLAGSNWINGGGKSGGDVDVPFNPSGPNRVFQKIPVMGKSHGSRTGKKSRIKGMDLMAMKNMLKNRKNKDTDMKPRLGKVMNFDDFQKGEINTITKVKEGKAYKSSKPDKKIGKEGLRLTDKKENFRTEIRNLIKSHDMFSIKQVGNDLSVNKGDDHIIQIMFRDDYVGIKKSGTKFVDEFNYNELGKIKSEITNILKKEK